MNVINGGTVFSVCAVLCDFAVVLYPIVNLRIVFCIDTYERFGQGFDVCTVRYPLSGIPYTTRNKYFTKQNVLCTSSK